MLTSCCPKDMWSERLCDILGHVAKETCAFDEMCWEWLALEPVSWLSVLQNGSRSLKELVDFFLHNHVLLSNVNRGKKLKASLRRSEKRMSNSVLRGLCVCQGPQVTEDQPCMLAKGYALLVARSLAHSLTAYVKYLV